MMPSFEFDIGEQARVGARFIADVRDEIQRALFLEKDSRKITQQQIADKLGTSRAVINRQIMGLENMTLRRVAEILWAIGWRPSFEAHKIPAGENARYDSPILRGEDRLPPMLPRKSEQIGGEPDPDMKRFLDGIINERKTAPVPVAA
jgi:transcriptional regulator with XRE-family HTH domain